MSADFKSNKSSHKHFTLHSPTLPNPFPSLQAVWPNKIINISRTANCSWMVPELQRPKKDPHFRTPVWHYVTMWQLVKIWFWKSLKRVGHVLYYSRMQKILFFILFFCMRNMSLVHGWRLFVCLFLFSISFTTVHYILNTRIAANVYSLGGFYLNVHSIVSTT